jgi:hypothetical protein
MISDCHNLLRCVNFPCNSLFDGSLAVSVGEPQLRNRCKASCPCRPKLSPAPHRLPPAFARAGGHGTRRRNFSRNNAKVTGVRVRRSPSAYTFIGCSLSNANCDGCKHSRASNGAVRMGRQFSGFRVDLAPRSRGASTSLPHSERPARSVLQTPRRVPSHRRQALQHRGKELAHGGVNANMALKVRVWQA